MLFLHNAIIHLPVVIANVFEAYFTATSFFIAITIKILRRITHADWM